MGAIPNTPYKTPANRGPNKLDNALTRLTIPLDFSRLSFEEITGILDYTAG